MTIVVATDGSPASMAALRFAARLAASGPSGELIVLNVDGRLSSESPSRVLDLARRELRAHPGRVRLEPLTARAAADVPETISRAADRLGADLIVVGSEGRDTLNEWVVSGTALRLLYLARRPVTVVRAPKRHRAA
jgi:nucleotide-binding universal stress UspA family protein